MDFFGEKELSTQISHRKPRWPIAIVKELIDNGLDAAEAAGVAPQIVVGVEENAVSVEDNGAGLPMEILERSLDYTVRVSDKAHYVSPTRGQQGNGLKTIWAVTYAWSGNKGHASVSSRGREHDIRISANRVAETPQIELQTSEATRRNGTTVRLEWPEVACYLGVFENGIFYNGSSVVELLQGYSLWNPHAEFALQLPYGLSTCEWPAPRPTWTKTGPTDTTSPHWYDLERFISLILAHVRAELAGGHPLTVREFVAQFRGLSSTGRQATVTRESGLSGAWLHDLVQGSEVRTEPITKLLRAMQNSSRPVAPASLGVVGEDRMRAWTEETFGVEAGGFRYKKAERVCGGLPFVLECAFAVTPGSEGRRLELGLNFAPSLGRLGHLTEDVLSNARIDPNDEVVLMIHLACPQFRYTDRGKTVVALPEEFEDAVKLAAASVAKEWKSAKRRARSDDRVREADLERLLERTPTKAMSIKQASYAAMPAAYANASGDGALPANARQIMYAARGRVQALTGGKLWSDDSYFTQHVLPDFVEEHPEITADWDVVFDARGHLAEPHSHRRLDLGTLRVRDYVASWDQRDAQSSLVPKLDFRNTGVGPRDRFRYVLFIEKEGFTELLTASDIANRFDIAVMSTKGMSTTAARSLIDALSREGVTILVARDFDKAGFSIVETLRSDSRRFRYRTRPRIVDIGLRLADAESMGLEREAVAYKDTVDPKIRLGECGATEEEYAVLVSHQTSRGWSGERIELNAMSSQQFISWLEEKLVEVGVTKVVPSRRVLEGAWIEAHRQLLMEAAAREADAAFVPVDVVIPTDLPAAIERALAADQTKCWDGVIAGLARDESEKRRRSTGRGGQTND